MSIKTFSTTIALAAAALAGFAFEAGASPACGHGGARYSAPRASVAKVAPVKVAVAAPVTATDANSGGDTAGEKIVKARKAASQAPAVDVVEKISAAVGEIPEVSVSAIAARMAASSGRRSTSTAD